MNASEHVIQREFVNWFRKTYPDTRIFAIPNGGERNKAIAYKLKLEGVSPGVPDLFIPEWRLWIEMKTLSGSLSCAQSDWCDHLTRVGYYVMVCHGLDEAKSSITSFLAANC